jgi:cytochrome c2
MLIVGACFFSACLNGAGTSKEEQSGPRLTSVEVFMPEQVRIIFKRSCESCHGADGRGIAGIAPNIKGTNRRNTGEWEQYLRNSHNAHPVSQAAPVWLDPDEIKIMAEFIAKLSQGDGS